MASRRRDQLIDTAIRLFQANGYHATGIDTIIAQAGVSKMTLYNHFKSKDELILAALRRADETTRNGLMRAVERRAKTPRERLLAIFDVLDEWFGQDDFCGCLFINATAEFAQTDDPIHAVAAEHKRLLRGYLHEQAIAARAANPDELASHLMLLVEGAIVTAQISAKQSTGAQAKSAARVLVESACDAR